MYEIQYLEKRLSDWFGVFDKYVGYDKFLVQN